MQRRAYWWAITVVGVLSTTALAWSQTRPTVDTVADESAQTRELFRQGLGAFNTGQVEEARALFRQAWAVRPSADIAMQLAQTEIDLGKYADAAEHLEYALANFTPSITDKMRAVAKQAYLDVIQRVAKLSLTVSPAGAEVFINGQSVGRAPLGRSIYADTGTCVLAARNGSAEDTKTLLAEAGQEVSVTLTVQPRAQEPPTVSNSGQPPAEAKPTPPAVRSTPAALPSAPHRSIIPVIIAGSVAAVGIGTGIGLRVQSNSEYDKASALRAKVAPGNCTTDLTHQADCSSLRSSLSKTDRERNWATASFVVGGVALLGAATYWFWPRSGSSQASKAWQIHVSANSQSGGILVESEF